MYCKCYVLLSYFFKLTCSLSPNLHFDLKNSREIENVENLDEISCKDIDKFNVDWWYVYKPPSEELPIYKLGRDFIYISSYKAGRWLHSGKHISPNSMLQDTLEPLFRSNSDSLAVLIYEEKKPNDAIRESTSFGLIMANELGGVWMGHTVPGLIDLTKLWPTFPEAEIDNGHLMMCLTLDLVTLNQMGILIQATSPRFTRIQLPSRLSAFLPDWKFLSYSGPKFLRPVPKTLDFNTRKKTLAAKMTIRKPGDQFCPYANFAKKMRLVLDIYGHEKHNMPYCFANYSIRPIKQISMKSVQYVHYIPQKRDKISFAVSTGTHWQRLGGSGKDQYWTCLGPTNDIPGNGAILMCVDHFKVWQSFDNFKTKEPVC